MKNPDQPKDQRSSFGLHILGFSCVATISIKKAADSLIPVNHRIVINKLYKNATLPRYNMRQVDCVNEHNTLTVY